MISGLFPMLDHSMAIFQNPRDAMIVRRKDTTILDADRAACDLGYDTEGPFGPGITDLKVTIRPDLPKPESGRAPGAPTRILLMDDDESILEVTSELLKYMGYLVECARDGKEALHTYEMRLREGNRFDLVIMDLTVPGGMGGKDAIKHLMSIDPRAKAIVSSGFSDGPVMANFRTYGFKGIMPKPYQIEQMSSEIERVLSGNEG